MLQIQQIKENKAATIEGLKRKYFKDAEENVQQLTDKHITLVETHLTTKEKEIMAV